MTAFALSILVFLLIACRQWFSALRLEFWQNILGFAEFARIGIPLTAAQALICHLFLS